MTYNVVIQFDVCLYAKVKSLVTLALQIKIFFTNMKNDVFFTCYTHYESLNHKDNIFSLNMFWICEIFFNRNSY